MSTSYQSSFMREYRSSRLYARIARFAIILAIIVNLTLIAFLIVTIANLKVADYEIAHTFVPVHYVYKY